MCIVADEVIVLLPAAVSACLCVDVCDAEIACVVAVVLIHVDTCAQSCLVCMVLFSVRCACVCL